MEESAEGFAEQRRGGEPWGRGGEPFDDLGMLAMKAGRAAGALPTSRAISEESCAFDVFALVEIVFTAVEGALVAAAVRTSPCSPGCGGDGERDGDGKGSALVSAGELI